LDFYISDDTVMTGAITCPKAGDEEAFQASYQRSLTLKMYNPDFGQESDGFRFSGSPPPRRKGLDPLRRLSLPNPHSHDENQLPIAAKTREALCSDAVEASRAVFGSFADLCAK
ncbi:hypothetical protein FOZ63_023822, partial [Perkinsus olseni]